jgi:hypothetical protein
LIHIDKATRGAALGGCDGHTLMLIFQHIDKCSALY